MYLSGTQESRFQMMRERSEEFTRLGHDKEMLRRSLDPAPLFDNTIVATYIAFSYPHLKPVILRRRPQESPFSIQCNFTQSSISGLLVF